MLNNNSGSMSGGSGDELKTQFMTREGCYRLMAQADYSRPNRVGYCSTTGGQVGGGGIGGSQGGAGGQGTGSQGGNPSGAPVKVSFALPGNPSDTSHSSVEDRIAFNFGREIFVYPYKGLKKAADLTKPLDKRLYKGTCPTCHDFGPPVNTGQAAAVNPDMDSGSSETGSTVLSNSSPPPQTAGTPLLVGFSGGQIQLIDPVRKELSKLFNEERHIEKTRVTCIKWVPTTSGGGNSNHFLVSYSSGCMYVYNHDLPCAPNTHAPVYQLFKQGQGYAVHTCKTKTTRNPLYKWAVGETVGGHSSSNNANSQASFVGSSSINEFAFSPCGHYLAVASQDGYLRVFNYDTMELVGSSRSYFGGLLCVCWSPDGKYIGVGGEDDLVTLYSMTEKRVVVRGQGHKSWVSVVAFDQYNMSYGELPDGLDFSGSDEESVPPENGTSQQSGGSRAHANVRRKMSSSSRRGSSFNNGGGAHDKVTCYRFGSVGQDTNLCLWDITEETLRTSKTESCNSASAGGVSSHNHKMSNSHSVTSKDSGIQLLQSDTATATGPGSESGKTSSSTSSSMSLSHRLASLNLTGGGGGGGSGEKSGGGSVRGTLKATLLRGGGSDKQSSSGGSSPSLVNKNAAGHGDGRSGGGGGVGSASQVRLGSAQCPRIHDVPVIEPLVNKKISHERLTALVFKEECLVTACQDGYVCTWARPGKTSSSSSSANANNSNSSNANNASLPSASSMKCPSSPQPGGGTVV